MSVFFLLPMKKQLQLFDIQKSLKPLIYGFITDERFYRFKKTNAFKNAQYKTLKIRSLLKPGIYTKYLKFENKAKINILRIYNKNDRFLIFLHYSLKFGRRKMHKITGISERYIREFLNELKNRN